MYISLNILKNTELRTLKNEFYEMWLTSTKLLLKNELRNTQVKTIRTYTYVHHSHYILKLSITESEKCYALIQAIFKHSGICIKLILRLFLLNIIAFTTYKMRHLEQRLPDMTMNYNHIVH